LMPPDGMSTPGACFTNLTGGKYDCLPPADAVRACTFHLGRDVVGFYYEKLSPRSFTGIMEEKANEIQRGLHYLTESKGESEPAFCFGLTKGIRPKVEELNRRGKNTLYGYY